MGVIHLVRHGQAAFGTDDYDRLTVLGREQAWVTGKALSARGIDPGLVVHGTLRRQRETAAALAEAAGWACPVEIDAGWDEYDADADADAVPADAVPADAALRSTAARAGRGRTVVVVSSAGTVAWTVADLLTGGAREKTPPSRGRACSESRSTARRRGWSSDAAASHAWRSTHTVISTRAGLATSSPCADGPRR